MTANGEEVARQLKGRLQNLEVTRVFTSPRQRAQRTCELAGLSAHMEIEPDLAEWNYGEYEGLRFAEILATRPDWNIFRDGCPDGESPVEISVRADRLINRLRALDEKIALFSHGHFGRVLAMRWIGQPITTAQNFFLDTASISTFDYDQKHGNAPVISLWNSRAHP